MTHSMTPERTSGPKKIHLKKIQHGERSADYDTILHDNTY